MKPVTFKAKVLFLKTRDRKITSKHTLYPNNWEKCYSKCIFCYWSDKDEEFALVYKSTTSLSTLWRTAGIFISL